MNIFRKFDERFSDSTFWQFVKFNIVSFSTYLLQLLLANLFPLIFDGFRVKLPLFLRSIFDPKNFFTSESIYVVDGVMTWGYVLPFFLSNFLANIYSYFVNMKATFKGQGSRKSIALYLIVLFLLILFSTWFQGKVMSALTNTSFASASRSIAASAAGMIQMLVLFPLEKFVLFKKKDSQTDK